MKIPQQQTIFQLVVKNTHTFWMGNEIHFVFLAFKM